MANPWVHQVDRIPGVHGDHVAVGVDHACVTIAGVQITPQNLVQFYEALARATYMAGQQDEAMGWAEK